MKYIYLLSFCLLLQSCTHDADQYAIKGIDVSHYQGQVNWESVAKQDIDFVFVKATEGLDYQDSIFTKNWEALSQTKLKRGAYHFFLPKVSASWQAKNFIRTVGLQTGDLPPVLDVEDLEGVSMEQLIQHMTIWLAEVEAYYGMSPIIYTFSDLYNRHLKAAFPNHTFWIARYSRQAPALDKQAVFWQYSNTGYIDGIEGAVDLNIFTGNYSRLQGYGKPPKSNLLQ